MKTKNRPTLKLRRISRNESVLFAYENFFHDLKTPLAIIYSYLQILENESDMPEQALGHIDEVKKNWFRMTKLINDAGDRARINGGALIPKFKNVELVALLKETAEATKTLAERKNIRLSFASDAEEKVMAVDRGMFERIILNLLSNAIKYTDRGGQVRVELSDRGNKVYLTVTDTGRGIPPEISGKVFDRNAAADQDKSSGLGLSIVKELTEILGGRVSIQSGPTGTTVTVKLPVFINDSGQPEKVDNFFNDNIIQIELSDIY